MTDAASDWFTQLVTHWVSMTPTIAILLILIGIDIVSGIIAAVYKQQLSSSTSFNGMLKKIMMLAIVAVGMCMEMLYQDIPWGKIAAMFFCCTECISILENAARCNVPLPPQIVDALKRYKAAADEARPLIGKVEIKTVDIERMNENVNKEEVGAK